MNDPQANQADTHDHRPAWSEQPTGDSGSIAVETRKPQPIGHLHCIDALRGLASLGVVVLHTTNAITQGSRNGVISTLHYLFQYGTFGVPLFFVISGFCIHRKQAERSAAGVDDSIPFRKYWKRRFFRLYPSYFTVCVGSAAFMAAAIATGFRSPLLTSYPGDPFSYLALDFLTHIFLIHSFFSLFDGGLGNPPLWTLAREEQYYLLYFPLLKFRKIAGVVACLILSIVVSFAVFRISNIVPDENRGLRFLLETSSLAFWPQWVLGMLCMEWLVSHRRSISPGGVRAAILTGLAIIVVQKEFPLSSWTRILMQGLGFYLIVSALTKQEACGRWIRTKCIRYLEAVGQYSYSLYLVNYPVLVIVGEFARARGSNDSLPMYLAFMALGIAVCNLAGYVLYALVERHGQRKPAES